MSSSDMNSQDLEQPGELPIIPKPSAFGNRVSTTGTDDGRMRSVVFGKDDLKQCIPSLPIEDLVDELKRRYGNKVYEAELAHCVEEVDGNGDGLISIPELVHIVEMMRQTKKENTSLRKLVGIGSVAMILFLVSIFGLVFAVNKLTKELSTGNSENANALVSSTTGRIVDTHPSDGGGIYLEMAAFTEPLNITFPGFDVTQECVGQVPVSQIQEHYSQFTTGGSTMTIRHVDYSQENQPVVFTVIPADTLYVVGFQPDANEALLAQEGTMAIKETQLVFGDNADGGNRKLRMTEAARKLEMMIMPNAKDGYGTEAEQKRQRADAPADNNNYIANKDTTTASYGGRGSRHNRRRLQAGEDLVTVDDYMDAFADKSITITYVRDNDLTEEVYFVCRAATPTVAVN